MDNEKDKNDTGFNSQGQNKMSFSSSITQKAIKDNLSLYDIVNKKTEKLVTALYMVTDCIAENDALKNKLRFLGVDLLSDMYDLSVVTDIQKHNQIDMVSIAIREIISYVEISCTIGFISEMNTAILKREFLILNEELKKQQIRNGHFSFVLNEEMFKTENENLKDIFIKDKSQIPLIKDKKTILITDKIIPKNDRNQKILQMIKNKKEVTIKDISNVFNDCSEKTIQRELNLLISLGQIKKTGSKRWSKYIWVNLG